MPAACGSGVGGSNVITVDLGGSLVVSEPHGAGSSPSYGHVARVALTPL